VLEHVEDDHAGLREVARVLKPGGLVAISVPANPAAFAWADQWAGHFRRYTRDAIVDLCAAAGLRVEACVGWGFPVSTLYHRHLYDRRLKKVGSAPVKRWQQPALWALRAALQVDRLFVGIERGALGYLVVAARQRA
jgi:SAM-dependent methyltransferase